MSEKAALITRIRERLFELEQIFKRVQLLAEKATTSGDDDYWDGVALNLHGFYTGVERIFEDIARTIDRSIPDGPYWHSSLLVQMSSESPKRRPAVITREPRYCLEEY
jgi:hypothetical protein